MRISAIPVAQEESERVDIPASPAMASCSAPPLPPAGAARQCVFLAGGLGTRLGALTRNCPKPLLTVNGLPFIAHLILNAARFGFSRFLVLAGYQGKKITEWFAGPGQRRLPADITVRVLEEPQPLGTGGALLHARPQLEESFLVCNGDSYFDCNLLAPAVPAAFDAPRVTRLLLRKMERNTRYGEVQVDGSLVRGFLPCSQGGPALINTGIYHFHRSGLDGFAAGRVSLEADILPRLVAQGRVEYRLHDGYFIDIGIPEDLARAERDHPFATPRPAIFFDRDGVLNHDAGYTHDPADLRWIDGAIRAVRWCNDQNFYVFVVTNQSGIARGIYTEAETQLFHRAMQEELRAAGAHVDDFIYCPHHKDGIVERYAHPCNCRKPHAGMLHSLMARWPVDRERSLLVGDKPSDLEAAAAAGIRGILFPGGDLFQALRKALKDPAR